MKFGLKYLRDRTPDVMFRIGNALVTLGSLSSIALIHSNPVTSAVICWAAIAGKFLTELFAEDGKKK